MPFRHTAPPSAGRPSGMRSDRHESRPMTSESSCLVAEQHPGSALPTAPATTGSTAGPADSGATTAVALRPSSVPARSALVGRRPAGQPPTEPSGPGHAAAHRVSAASTGIDGTPTDPAASSATTLTPPTRPGEWRRRSLLRIVGASALGVPAVAVLAACAEDDTVHAPDPLAAQAVLARADAAAAQAAIALAPQSQAVLTTIATERGAHADALRTEIDRVIGVYGDGTTPVHRTGEVMVPGPDGRSVPASVAATPTQPLTLAQLRDQLVRSQQSAATAARTQSGYRAGLLASISAACATQAGVLLT
ncbi:hypothetical protein [Nocardia sp. NPDC050717]|uniref:hypothetical protein n=1 Tax=Nocardia sp. NPDC050717 TaxID=3157221 RepID=UPI0033E4A85C